MIQRIRAAAISLRRNGWPYGEWPQHVVRIAAAGSDKTPEDFVAFIRDLPWAKRQALKNRPHTVSPPLPRQVPHEDRDEERESRIRAQYEEAIQTLGEHVTVSGIAQQIGKEEFFVRSYLRQHPDLGQRVLPD